MLKWVRRQNSKVKPLYFYNYIIMTFTRKQELFILNF